MEMNSSSFVGVAMFLGKLVETEQVAVKNTEVIEAMKAYAEATWERGILRKGPGLCHGISGNAYTFLAMKSIESSETEWVRDVCRALLFCEVACRWALNDNDWDGSSGMNGMGLFEGLAGVGVLVLDLWKVLNEMSGGKMTDGAIGFPCFTDL
jgi:hypothetical protein